MKVVNQPLRKKDAMQLVTGQPVYVDDVTPRDCLCVKLLRSPHANAIVKSINKPSSHPYPSFLHQQLHFYLRTFPFLKPLLPTNYSLLHSLNNTPYISQILIILIQPILILPQQSIHLPHPNYLILPLLTPLIPQTPSPSHLILSTFSPISLIPLIFPPFPIYVHLYLPPSSQSFNSSSHITSLYNIFFFIKKKNI